MRVKAKVPTFLLLGLVATVGLTACSANTGNDSSLSPELAITSQTPTPNLPPDEKFISALTDLITGLKLKWIDSSLEEDRGPLHEFLKEVTIEKDEKFEIVTITGEAKFTGDYLSDGTSIGIFPVYYYCAGKNYLTRDTFALFHSRIFGEMIQDSSITSEDFSTLQFPTKGILIRLNWFKEEVDKFGALQKQSIGTDQIGVSTSNLKKIVDPYQADFRKLSDLAPVRYAKQSWYNGRCANDQKIYND